MVVSRVLPITVNPLWGLFFRLNALACVVQASTLDTFLFQVTELGFMAEALALETLH